jgi:hypothetical protein
MAVTVDDLDRGHNATVAGSFVTHDYLRLTQLRRA